MKFVNKESKCWSREWFSSFVSDILGSGYMSEGNGSLLDLLSDLMPVHIDVLTSGGYLCALRHKDGGGGVVINGYCRLLGAFHLCEKSGKPDRFSACYGESYIFSLSV